MQQTKYYSTSHSPSPRHRLIQTQVTRAHDSSRTPSGDESRFECGSSFGRVSVDSLLTEEIRQELNFVPDRMLTMLYASNCEMFGDRQFNNHKMALREAQYDLMGFERCLQKFGFEGNNQYILDENPSLLSCLDASEQLAQCLAANHDEKTLVMHVFTGTAVDVDGMRCLVLNELSDDDPSFCKVFKAEYDIKTLAQRYPSSYHIAVFGCQMLTDAVIDVSEEDGSILVSPVKLINQYINLKPSSSLIRVQGLDSSQRTKALNRAYMRLDYDLDIPQTGKDDENGSQSFFVSLKNENNKQSVMQRLQKFMIEVSSLEPYSLNFPNLFKQVGKNPSDIGLSLSSTRNVYNLNLERVDIQTLQKVPAHLRKQMQQILTECDTNSNKSQKSTAPDDSPNPALDDVRPLKLKLIPCELLTEDEDPLQGIGVTRQQNNLKKFIEGLSKLTKPQACCMQSKVKRTKSADWRRHSQ